MFAKKSIDVNEPGNRINVNDHLHKLQTHKCLFLLNSLHSLVNKHLAPVLKLLYSFYSLTHVHRTFRWLPDRRQVTWRLQTVLLRDTFAATRVSTGFHKQSFLWKTLEHLIPCFHNSHFNSIYRGLRARVCALVNKQNMNESRSS